MPPQQTLKEKVEQYKRELDQLQTQLELIKREYDLFFAGQRKRQPYEMRAQIERTIRRWQQSTIQKVELTFRLNTLNSKFISMCDVWDKIMKRRETDPHALSPYGPSRSQLAAEMAAENRAREDNQRAERPTAERPRESSDERMRSLFNQFVDAKKDMGETVEALSYARFKDQIEKQLTSIREKAQCKDVEFSVVRRNGKVSLSAKPVRE